jgi:lipid-A-disaccharide synthase
VIFPFEVEYFRSRGVEAEYYGNPLMDGLADFRIKNTGTNLKAIAELDERPVIALLSGSRVHEISRCLPAMLEATDEFHGYQRVIAGAMSIEPEYYSNFINGRDVKLVHDKTYELLNIANVAVVTSGTATLETALFRVPQVVVYRTNPVQYELIRHIVKIKFFSLVNLIAGKEVVKELLQKNLSARTNTEMKKILEEKGYYNKIQTDYDDIINTIGRAGCSEQIAERIINLLQSPVL